MKKVDTGDPLDRKFTLKDFPAKGVRGKYARRIKAGTNLVRLDPAIARRFPSEKAVNEALASVIHLSTLPQPEPRSSGRPRKRKVA